MSYVIIFWTSLKDGVRKKEKKIKEKARGDTTCLPQIPSEKNNKRGISRCGSFIVAYLRPAASIDRLHLDQGMMSYGDHAPRTLRTMGHVIWGLSAEYNGDYRPRTIQTTDQRFYGLSGLQPKVLRNIRTTDQRFYGLYGLQTKGFTQYTDYRPKVLRNIRTTDQRFYGLYGLQTKGFTDYTDYRPKVLRTIRTTDQRFHGPWTADYTDYRPKVLRTIRTDYTQFPLSPIREGNLERDGGRPEFVKA